MAPPNFRLHVDEVGNHHFAVVGGMLRRYASITTNERAIAASRKLTLGDKL